MEIRKVKDLRSVLVDQINKLRRGDATPAQTNAVTNATGKIISTLRMEIEYAALVKKTPNIDFLK